MPENPTQFAGQVPIDLIYLNMLAFVPASENIAAVSARTAAATSLEELPTEEEVMATGACGAWFMQPNHKPYTCTLSKHTQPIHVAHISDSEPVFAWVDVPIGRSHPA